MTGWTAAGGALGDTLDLGEGLSFSAVDMVKSVVVGNVALKVNAVGTYHQEIPVLYAVGKWKMEKKWVVRCPYAMFVFV